MKVFNMDKVTTRNFWQLMWNVEEVNQFHLMYEFIEQGTELLEKMSGDPVTMDDVKDHLKMLIDNME